MSDADWFELKVRITVSNLVFEKPCPEIDPEVAAKEARWRMVKSLRVSDDSNQRALSAAEQEFVRNAASKGEIDLESLDGFIASKHLKHIVSQGKIEYDAWFTGQKALF
ncbi:MAG: hypothetical protein ACKO0Z_25515 [Betaproteobacteria bacterium]